MRMYCSWTREILKIVEQLIWFRNELIRTGINTKFFAWSYWHLKAKIMSYQNYKILWAFQNTFSDVPCKIALVLLAIVELFCFCNRSILDYLFTYLSVLGECLKESSFIFDVLVFCNLPVFPFHFPVNFITQIILIYKVLKNL